MVLRVQRILSVLMVLLLLSVSGGANAQVRLPNWVKPSVVDRHGDLILAQGRVFPTYRPAPVYRPPPMATVRPPVFRPPTPIIKPPVMRVPRIGPPVSTLRAPAVRLPGPASRLASLPRSLRPPVLLPGRGISTFASRKGLTLRDLRPNAGVASRAIKKPMIARTGVSSTRGLPPNVATNGVVKVTKAAKLGRGTYPTAGTPAPASRVAKGSKASSLRAIAWVKSTSASLKSAAWNIKMIGAGRSSSARAIVRSLGGGGSSAPPWRAANDNNRPPPNNGFAGKPLLIPLQRGMIIDRYGTPYGKFFSPQGTSFEARSIDPTKDSAPLRTYRVLKPFNVLSGAAAPWYGQRGGGMQYYSQTISAYYLEKHKFIQEVK